MEAAPTDLDLLLIGKTGNGKSQTGNSILGFEAFEAKASTNSVTTDTDYDVCNYKGKIIKVVDGPGVGDTRLNNKKAVKQVVDAMENAVRMNSRGYHAFLLVVRFGSRFTQEDVDTVDFLKSVFGEHFVKNFCILVMTFGDFFMKQKMGSTFSDWCQEQTGVFKQLLEECDERIILFNNDTNIVSEREAQLDKLIEMIAGLASQGHRYSDSHFEKASTDRQKALTLSEKPIIQEETMQECSLILQELEKTRLLDNFQKQKKGYEGIKERAVKLLSKIQEEDKGTKALHDIEEYVQGIVKTVSEAIDAHVRVEPERCLLKKLEEEHKLRMEEQAMFQMALFKENMEKEIRSWEEMREKEKKLEEERREREQKLRMESLRREKALQQELEEAKER